MKSLIKIGAFFCVIMSVIVSSAFAAEISNDEGLLLSELGVVDKDSVYSAKQMSRAEFVSLFSSIKNVKGLSSGVSCSFGDVSLSDSYGDALAWLIVNNAISDNKFFYPDSPVTYENAVKIMVAALGYSREAEIQGGYPNGYLKIGTRLGLNKGVDISNFNSSDAYKMMVNALDVEVSTFEAYSENNDKQKKSMLEEYFKVKNVKGIMTKNSLSSISSKFSSSSTFVTIGDETFNCGSRFDSLLGNEVIAYFSIDDKTEDDMICICPTSKNKVVTFSSYNAEYSNFTYTVSNDSSKNKVYKIDRSIDIVYNDRKYSSIAKEEFLPKDGCIELVDNDGDNVYEVLKITSYDYYIAGNGTADGKITDKLGKPTIDTENDCAFRIYLDGEETTVNQIEMDDLLIIKQSRGEEEKLIQVDIVRNNITGDLIGNDSEYEKISIGGKEYETTAYLRKLIAENSKQLDKIKLGNRYIFYMDNNGRVAYFDDEVNQDVFTTFARKLYVAEDEKTNEENVFFRLMKPNGDFIMAKAAKSVKLDGKSVSRNYLIDIVKSNVLSAPMPFKCKLNSNDEVTYLETLGNPKTYGQYTYKRASRAFDGFVSLKPDCTVIVIPGDGYENDESLYELRNVSYFGDGTGYTFDAYNVDDAVCADTVVIRGAGKTTSIAADNPILIVKSVGTVINEQNESSVQIEVISPTGGDIKYITKDLSTEYVDRITGEYLTFDNLKKGDVLRVVTDNSGKLINGEKVVDLEKLKENYNKGAYNINGGYRDGLNLRGGYIYARSEDIIAMTSTSTAMPTDADIKNKLVVYSALSPVTLVYNLTDDTVRAGSINDIKAYKDFDDLSNTSYVFIHTMLGVPRNMIIYTW